jgi:hypothetical protein
LNRTKVVGERAGVAALCSEKEEVLMETLVLLADPSLVTSVNVAREAKRSEERACGHVYTNVAASGKHTQIHRLTQAHMCT